MLRHGASVRAFSDWTDVVGLAEGDLDGGIWTVGQSQGLIHDIPTCAELVSRIMRDAEAIIRSRLEGMMSGAQRQAAE